MKINMMPSHILAAARKKLAGHQDDESMDNLISCMDAGEIFCIYIESLGLEKSRFGHLFFEAVTLINLEKNENE